MAQAQRWLKRLLFAAALYDMGAYEMPFLSEHLYLPLILKNG